MAMLHLNHMFIADYESTMMAQVLLGNETITLSGEDRQQVTASGDLRVISSPIEFQDLDYSIGLMERETYLILKDMRGHLVLIRTPRGWKQWAVLSGVTGSEVPEENALSVSITILECSYDETA